MTKQNGRGFFGLLVEISLWACILVLTFGALGALSTQIEAVLFRYPLDYGEAPLVNQAMELNAGNSIYRQSILEPPYTIANYPPVYVGILALFEKAFGPVFWYGRLISVLSAIGSAVMLFLIVNSRSRNWKLALIPALVFFNIPYVIGWSMLARIDHLALFFALAGLFALFNKKASQRIVDLNLIFGSVLLVLAIFTRQSYALAAPLAGFLYLLQKDWRRAAILTGLVGGLSLILFALLNLLTNGGFYFNIVTANINPFGVERVVNNFKNFLDMAPFLFILSVFGIILIIQKVDGWPLLIGFAFGGFFSAITIGKIGSNINYFLEFAAGLSLLVGFGLIVLARRSKKAWNALILCVFLSLVIWQGVRFIEKVQMDTRGTLDTRQEAIEELQDLELLVGQNLEGPILADEYMGMIVLNDESLYLQPFEITQLAIGGLFEQEILLDQIKAETFSLILLQEDSWWVHALQERWTPEMLETIRAHYRLSGQFESTFAYKPKTVRSISAPTDCPAGVWPLPTSATMGYRYEEGWLSLYGAGSEGTTPVKAVASGEVYRTENFPDGSLAVVHEDPLNPGERVILVFKDMRSSRGGESLISETFPIGSKGLVVNAGETLGFQTMWAGRAFKQDWLHVTFGIAPFDPAFLESPELLGDHLLDPGTYFGIRLDPEGRYVRPVICLGN
jgi:hypothetical protein